MYTRTAIWYRSENKICDDWKKSVKIEKICEDWKTEDEIDGR